MSHEYTTLRENLILLAMIIGAIAGFAGLVWAIQ